MLHSRFFAVVIPVVVIVVPVLELVVPVAVLIALVVAALPVGIVGLGFEVVAAHLVHAVTFLVVVAVFRRGVDRPRFADIIDFFLQTALTELFQLGEQNVVFRIILVPCIKERTHQAENIGNKCEAVFRVFGLRSFFQKQIDIAAVMAELQVLLVIVNPERFFAQRFFGWRRERAVDIQLETGNNVQVVPQLVGIVLIIPHVGMYLTHKLDQDVRVEGALSLVLDLDDVVGQFLYVTTVFFQWDVIFIMDKNNKFLWKQNEVQR